MTEHVAILGLGRMGSAMAEKLARDGCAVTGWTRSGGASEHFRVAATLGEAVAASDVLILSLLDDGAVRDVLGQMAGLDLGGKLVVETSTVSPEVSREMAGGIEAAGGRIIDAPISGGPEMLAAGTAGIYIGGAEGDCARFMPVGEHLSDRIVPVGELGAGAAAKIVNNVALAGAFQAITDSIRLGDAMGLSLEVMLDFLKDSPAMTPMFRARIPKMLGEDATVGFALDAVLKDNTLFLDTARAFDVEVPAVTHMRKFLEEAIAAGLGDADPAALVGFAIGR